MRYQNLGGMPLAPSLICLGGGPLGSAIPPENAFELLDVFAEAGGNWVDTAHVYASWLADGAGVSERTIGAWIKARGVRSSFMVGTKGAHPLLSTMRISRLRPADISQDLSESLERLQSDYVDIYWLHRDDPSIPVGEILGALNEHLAAGRVRALGASNWTVARLQEAAVYAAGHRLVGFCASQIGWSLAQPNPVVSPYAGTLNMDETTMAYHVASGLPVVAYSSQANGFFGGRYSRASANDPAIAKSGIARSYFNEINFGRLERTQVLAQRLGQTPNAIAVAYLTNQAFAGYAIAGCRTIEQVRDSCAAVDVRLGPDDLAWLVSALPANY
jgi:aryl-alcohol dehydrogenase-like predicted oxidoreductase